MKAQTLGYAALIGGVAAIAACVYFDYRRHRDPDFRRKLRERRQRLKKQHLPHYEITPREVDPKFREALIIDEIQTAERLMVDERYDEAVAHFARAISVCADPGHLLGCLRRTLDVSSYDRLVELLVRMHGDRFNTSGVDADSDAVSFAI